ncbi:tyrosine-type recombinase/integrase [Ferrovibrio terrae]|uniref:tyrosine-type recombinase/integrase n=1 Tax=Ferrovibrio terrae TaxID=2594003 RepID=UPI003137DA2C
MTAKKKVAEVPRMLSLEATATYLGLTIPELTNLLPELQDKGFPNPIPTLGLWDRKVLDIWLDRESGISTKAYGFYPPEPQKLNPASRTPSKQILPSSNPTQNIGYTVAECIDDYMRWFRCHRRRVRETQYQINASILPKFGHRLVSSLTVKEIRKWHDDISKSPKSIHAAFGEPRRYGPPPKTDEEKRKRKNTANRDLSILKAALNMAYRDGLVETDAGWRGAKQFRLVEVSSAECLSVAECQQLLPHLSPDFRELVRGALFTGARFTELAQVTAGDFDERAGSIYLLPSKNFSSRHVILTEEGSTFFRRMTHNLHKNDIVFRRADGSQWLSSDCSHRLKIPCQLAGLRHVTFHMFRHTYASMLAMSAVPIAVIAKNLGHQSTETCEKFYAHFTKSYVADTIRTNTPKLGIDDPVKGDIRNGAVGIRTNDRTATATIAPQQIPVFSMRELRQRATERGIVGRYEMSKVQLMAALGL